MDEVSECNCRAAWHIESICITVGTECTQMGDESKEKSVRSCQNVFSALLHGFYKSLEHKHNFQLFLIWRFVDDVGDSISRDFTQQPKCNCSINRVHFFGCTPV